MVARTYRPSDARTDVEIVKERESIDKISFRLLLPKPACSPSLSLGPYLFLVPTSVSLRLPKSLQPSQSPVCLRPFVDCLFLFSTAPPSPRSRFETRVSCKDPPGPRQGSPSGSPALGCVVPFAPVPSTVALAASAGAVVAVKAKAAEPGRAGVPAWWQQAECPSPRGPLGWSLAVLRRCRRSADVAVLRLIRNRNQPRLVVRCALSVRCRFDRA